MDEGVVKYRCDWKEADPVAAGDIADLMEWRERLHSWGLIAVYENGIGFGNVSVRIGNSCQFVISGTQTAHLPDIGPESYCTVTEFNLEQNFLGCRGPVPASSESLTHAALYLHRDDVGGIIHVHNPQLWHKLLFEIPTTRKEIPYGTPQMALEMFRLFDEENLAERKILAMAGHEDGIICFGTSLDEAGKVLSAAIG
ncbi:class II aldolase/adducin family protein [Microcoleus sp. LEGE 07076]|uniref:class II aldolase/adducin family protein n=1 Tax=Microcoleus sp. LEGE 07076 TaxID=915322 RepID=UPI0018807BFC|nr:class II aldolase/adducin family protein [Microcoleus sp. LEGE 07076]MBE9183786.1 class II aldolase/adducin family protein [Microcoleus sp. LEGE 07076]